MSDHSKFEKYDKKFWMNLSTDSFMGIEQLAMSNPTRHTGSEAIATKLPSWEVLKLKFGNVPVLSSYSCRKVKLLLVTQKICNYKAEK